MWLLARRDYPRRQLEEKLRKRELSPAEIKSLLDSLIESGFFKEDAFKKLRTRQLLRRGDGPSLIKAKMSRDRIVPSNEELTQAYEDLELNPEQQIKLLIEKYTRRYAYLDLDARSLKQRIIQAIMRKGFPSSTIIQQVNSHFSSAAHVASGWNMPKEWLAASPSAASIEVWSRNSS